jgi:NADH-quinone oxidoreductase subunit J
VTALVWIVGALALICAVMVVAAPKTLYSALWLVANMVLLAVLFLLLNAQFLAAVQVIIYAGAIMVLFVFIIALLSPGSGTDVEEHRDFGLRFLVGLVAVVFVTGTVFVLANNGTTFDKNSPDHTLRGQQVSIAANFGDYNAQAFQYNVDDVNAHGNVQVVGETLFTRFLLPFEITSLLLLVAAIGAVYLTRHHRGEPRGQV